MRPDVAAPQEPESRQEGQEEGQGQQKAGRFGRVDNEHQAAGQGRRHQAAPEQSVEGLGRAGFVFIVREHRRHE